MPAPILYENDLSPEMVKELACADELGVDCEMMGLNFVRDRLCMVQIAVETGHCALVRITPKKESPLLKKLFEDRSIRKIFHFARTDILFLYTYLKIDVQNIYCTKIASRIARTYTDRHGLPELVREFIGKTMDKTYQSSDWGAAELNPKQIQYAKEDTIYLFEIRRCLERILEREGRRDIFQKLIEFLPVQRELDQLGYKGIFEHRMPTAQP